jgi:hypothetical protein
LVFAKFLALIFFWNRMFNSAKVLSFGSGMKKYVNIKLMKHVPPQKKAARAPQFQADLNQMVSIVISR